MSVDVETWIQIWFELFKGFTQYEHTFMRGIHCEDNCGVQPDKFYVYTNIGSELLSRLEDSCAHWTPVSVGKKLTKKPEAIARSKNLEKENKIHFCWQGASQEAVQPIAAILEAIKFLFISYNQILPSKNFRLIAG